MTLETAPCPMEPRWLVWTDHTAASHALYKSLNTARWFWSASGPRGHMSGAEGTAEAAQERAYAAAHLLQSAQERKSSGAAA